MRICKKCGRGELTYDMMVNHLELCYDKKEYGSGNMSTLINYYRQEGGLRPDKLEF